MIYDFWAVSLQFTLVMIVRGSLQTEGDPPDDWLQYSFLASPLH